MFRLLAINDLLFGAAAIETHKFVYDLRRDTLPRLRSRHKSVKTEAHRVIDSLLFVHFAQSYSDIAAGSVNLYKLLSSLSETASLAAVIHLVARDYLLPARVFKAIFKL